MRSETASEDVARLEAMRMELEEMLKRYAAENCDDAVTGLQTMGCGVGIALTALEELAAVPSP